VSGEGVFEALECCPEWCDREEKAEGAEHGEVCPEAPFAPEHYTKGLFVAGAQANAWASITAYLFCLEEGDSHEDALEQAVAEAEEIATCFGVALGSSTTCW
jgi:hypothetical protein